MKTVIPVVSQRWWVVTCPYCNGNHAHSPAPGVRLAHCWGGSYRISAPA